MGRVDGEAESRHRFVALAARKEAGPATNRLLVAPHCPFECESAVIGHAGVCSIRANHSKPAGLPVGRRRKAHELILSPDLRRGFPGAQVPVGPLLEGIRRICKTTEPTKRSSAAYPNSSRRATKQIAPLCRASVKGELSMRGVLLAVVISVGAAIQLALPALTSAQTPDLLDLEKTANQTAEDFLPSTSQRVTETLQEIPAPSATDADERDESATAAMKEVTKTVEPVVKDGAKVAEPVVETLPRAGAPVVEPVSNTTKPVIEPVTETVAPVVKTVTETAAPALDPIRETVEEVTQPVAKAVEPFAAITQPVIESLEHMTKPVVDAVAPVLAPVMEGVQSVVQPVIDIVEPVVIPVAEAVNPDIDIIDPVIGPVIEIVDPTIEPVIDVAPPVLPSLTPPVETPAELPTPITPSASIRTFDPAMHGIRRATEFVNGLERAAALPPHVPFSQITSSAFTSITPFAAGDVAASSTQSLFWPTSPLKLTLSNAGSSDADTEPVLSSSTAVRPQTALIASEMLRGMERLDGPSSGLLLQYMALAFVGYLLLLTVTKASPRSWQSELATPPN